MSFDALKTFVSTFLSSIGLAVIVWAMKGPAEALLYFTSAFVGLMIADGIEYRTYGKVPRGWLIPYHYKLATSVMTCSVIYFMLKWLVE